MTTPPAGEARRIRTPDGRDWEITQVRYIGGGTGTMDPLDPDVEPALVASAHLLCESGGDDVWIETPAQWEGMSDEELAALISGAGDRAAGQQILTATSLDLVAAEIDGDTVDVGDGDVIVVPSDIWEAAAEDERATFLDTCRDHGLTHRVAPGTGPVRVERG